MKMADQLRYDARYLELSYPEQNQLLIARMREAAAHIEQAAARDSTPSDQARDAERWRKFRNMGAAAAMDMLEDVFNGRSLDESIDAIAAERGERT